MTPEKLYRVSYIAARISGHALWFVFRGGEVVLTGRWPLGIGG